ncbi:Uncharacterised protein [Mycobacterium tuberculosis]|nr:Uncharacterised protein [Mycobacterium tuberculosis]
MRRRGGGRTAFVRRGAAGTAGAARTRLGGSSPRASRRAICPADGGSWLRQRATSADNSSDAPGLTHAAMRAPSARISAPIPGSVSVPGSASVQSWVSVPGSVPVPGWVPVHGSVYEPGPAARVRALRTIPPMPVSTSLTSSASSTTLPGLRSPCVTPAACARSSAAATWPHTSAVS